MKESKISHRQLIKKEDAIVYLEDMINSLKSDKIVIERNGQFVSMTTPDLMNMELTAKEKKDKNELSIEFTWRKEPFVPDIAPLNISCEEPPEPPAESDDEESAEAKEAPSKSDAEVTKKADSAAAKPLAEGAKSNPKAPGAKTK